MSGRRMSLFCRQTHTFHHEKSVWNGHIGRKKFSKHRLHYVFRNFIQSSINILVRTIERTDIGNMGKGVLRLSVDEGNMVGMGGGGDVFTLRSTSSVSVPGRIECREEGIAGRVIQHSFGGTKDYKRLG